jgi:hypothetical protein
MREMTVNDDEWERRMEEEDMLHRPQMNWEKGRKKT